ncbi:alpha/beta hydrolase [Alkalibacterium olivapovliticus]|uniref:Alpha/beta hydrolase family protein n=1 Tax=Alkalibacterium olivapovliticus TaxID=99907 RepID=A0A2T0W808_9LACT|nr:alpha/beta hydrolase [Alkalibacterium olivapovliticus]PRY82835.1 alpha/beta hydrolase family protein [Alkalibacterium olivapovliticus]
MQKIKVNWKKMLIGVIVLFSLMTVGLYLLIQSRTYEAMDEARAILNEEQVSQEDGWIKIEAEDRIGTIVFYQGAFVEAEAYLPLAKKLSTEGFRVFIPYMPLNLAILNSNAFEEIIEEYRSDEEWWIGGHSLGGASASIYAASEEETIDGLFFLAAYPSDSSDLSEKPYPIVSITAANDIIVNEERFDESKDNLPDHTVFYTIDGGNHAGFGNYGFQSGDGAATITQEDQQEQVVDIMMSVLLEND